MTANPIQGYLDSVTERFLQGWIANVDAPDRLEPVTCRAENGLERAFSPFMPRYDVCNALGRTGRFGFAIPLQLLHGFGASVSLHDATGAALGNAARIELPPLPPPETKPCRFVLHIQKTAGTSLRTALSAGLPPGEVLFLYPDNFLGLTSREFSNLPEWQRGALRLVMGHVPFQVAEWIPGPVEYISFLREPKARLRSHYFHHLAGGTTLEAEGEIHDLPNAVSHGATEEFDNLMVRIIANAPANRVPIGAIDEAHVDVAMHHIRTRFRFLGLVERMEAHYAALAKALELPIATLPVENVSRIAPNDARLRHVDWDQAMRRNRFDVMLYERVQREGLAGRDLA